MERGKSWWKPKGEIYKGPSDRGRKKFREDRSGQRGMSEMRIRSLSTPEDVDALNRYLWDIRRSIVNWQVDGDKILENSISSAQVASGSVAGSCLAGPLIFDDSLSASKYVCAGSGFITNAFVSAATHGYIGSALNVSGDITAGSAAGTGNLILGNDAWISGAMGVTQTISTAGDLLGSTAVLQGTLYCSGSSFLTGIASEDDIAPLRGNISGTGTLKMGAATISGALSSFSDVTGEAGTFTTASATGNMTADTISANSNMVLSGDIDLFQLWKCVNSNSAGW